MPGEWMAWQKGLARKPEVLQIARGVGLHRRYVAAALMEFWEWAEENTTDGKIVGVGLAELAGVLPEVTEAMLLAIVQVGWLKVTGAGLEIPNFERWMGDSAKARLQKNRRQARWREGQNVDDAASTKAPTRREESRREKKSGGKPPETPDAAGREDTGTLGTTEQAPRKRDELFDVLTEVTASDQNLHGSKIGRLCADLRRAKPPYTPAEVRKFVELMPTAFPWAKGQLTTGFIKEHIGVVRSKLPPPRRGNHAPAKPNPHEYQGD